MINELNKICETIEKPNLENYNTYRLKSTSDFMIFPSNEEELIESINYLNNKNIKWFIIGNGSNIILPEHYNGVIINLKKFNNYEIKDDKLYIQSGYMINKIANKMVKEGYKGIDFAIGIPGTIGGSIVGNAGCYGSSISDVLESIRVFNGEKIIELKNDDLKFEYRNSVLKNNNWAILSAIFKMEKANKEDLAKLAKERTEKRMASQDLSHPSNGSVFRNPEGMSAGKLIDDLGLKGTRVNGAMVSYKHANFIINDNNATSKDIIELINIIKKSIKDNYSIDLFLEQEIIK